MKTLMMIAAFASSAVLLLPTISQAQTGQLAAYRSLSQIDQLRA
jgi:TctA family transporter